VHLCSLKLWNHASLASALLIGLSACTTLTIGGGELSEVVVTGSHLNLQSPVWNTWAEKPYSSQPVYRPIQPQPNTEFNLVLNLGAFYFKDSNVSSNDVSSNFKSWLKEHKDLKAVNVDVLIDPDRQYFLPLARSERVRQLSIDMGKMEKYSYSTPIPDKPFAVLRQQGQAASFNFGTTVFKLRTGGATGTAVISVSIWVDQRPVDELTVPICIAAAGREKDCDTLPVNAQSLHGIDLSKVTHVPDAALHLIDSDSRMVAVFRSSNCQSINGYLVWEISNSSEWLSSQLSSIEKKLGVAPDPASGSTVVSVYTAEGEELLATIFPKEQSEAWVARKCITALVQAEVDKGVRASGKTAPTLFARLIPDRPDLVLLPLNILPVKLTNGTRTFVGTSVNVESALEFEPNVTSSKCVKQWHVFAPPDDVDESDQVYRAVALARKKAAIWIQKIKQSCDDCASFSEQAFEAWLQNGDESPGEGIITLSHHVPDSLYFHDDGNPNPSVGPQSIERTFTQPSFALLAGCGTGQVGASQFIRGFNSAGVRTIIATSTEVDGDLAGEFVNRFLSRLSANSVDVGQARFDTVQSLISDSYGPSALLFVLAGNPATVACVPTRP
jgi:hypothetical protein